MANGQRRVLFGVLAGVVAALVLLTVAVGGYRAGQDDDEVTRVVETVDETGEPSGDGNEVVRVVDDDDRDWGPGPGFLLFPLFVILLVVLAVRAGRGGGHGWGRHGWHGPYGPGPRGMGCDDDPRAGWLDDWHRRAHARAGDEGDEDTEPVPPDAPSSA